MEVWEWKMHLPHVGMAGGFRSALVTAFQEAKPPAPGIPPSGPVADTLPLDIHVIIKKAGGGTGGIQVTKPATEGGLNPPGPPVTVPTPKTAALAAGPWLTAWRWHSHPAETGSSRQPAKLRAFL
mmetsp:Transcript_58741/g.110027  ORF Transcript_58741/g.110027 Transcript_58741/m.110027 type:complete len:125 (+) Transcript_58741:6-380(+)